VRERVTKLTILGIGPAGVAYRRVKKIGPAGVACRKVKK